jgi:hypothetical protein
MNFKTTLILLVLLVIVGGYIVVDRLVSNKETTETVVDSKKLFQVGNKDDVTSLTIKSNDGSEIVLNKDDASKWRMKKPFDAATDTWEVDSLVRSLVDLESGAQVDPKDKGLEKPKYQIEMSAKGGKLIKFAIGDKTQLGNMYIQVAGSKMADVVPSDVYDRLGKPANELRDKQLVSTPSMSIKQMVIQSEGQKLVLQRNGSQWELVEPKKLPADESVMTDLLGAVTGLRASDWVAADSPDVGKAQFDKPQMTLAFTTAAPATPPATTTAPASQPVWTTVAFGQYEDIRHQKVYAKLSDSPAYVKVSATALDTLTKKPIELRDKKVIDIMPEQVSRLSIATDIPSGPAPTTKPGKKTSVEIERRKQVAAAEPATKPATTTQPTTQAAATTQASQPTTQADKPPVPQSTWVLASDPKGDADDEAVRNLLNELHPLRVSKYLESTPATKPAGGYVVKFTTEGPGGTPVTNYQASIIDPGGDHPLLGEYNGLSFELPRTLLTRIEGNFAKKAKAADTTAKPASPDDFKGPGEK